MPLKKSPFMVLLALLASPIMVGADPLRPGDIVVANQSSGNLFRIDPISGAASLISTEGLLHNPSHLIIDQQGRVLTAERGPFDTPGIVRVDPSNGSQTLLTPAMPGFEPLALAFDQTNNLVIGNQADQLIRVNAQSGMQTFITTITGISNIQDVDVDQDGRIVFLDFGSINSGGGKIVRYDPSSGLQTTIATMGILFNPSDLVIRPTGDYIVANARGNLTEFVRVDPNDGSQNVLTRISSQGFIALQDQNTPLYADFYRNLSVLRIDLLGGPATNVSTFQFPSDVVGIAIFVPEPSTWLLVVVGACLMMAVRYQRQRIPPCVSAFQSATCCG